jgi:hypothetical protein
MDLITVIIVLIVAAIVVALVSWLSAPFITDFVRERRTSAHRNRQASVVKKILENGRVRVWVGFLDGNAVEEIQTFEAEQTDSTIKSWKNEKIISIEDKTHNKRSK